ncbi:MAG: VCBS repeat-containing protein [Planctomycetes bacterium]|jgi:hypothetical protein|nr:VCBS repeat-containing protein [Planctomycetota bacterium]
MRQLAPMAVVGLALALPGQTRQFDWDAHRGPTVLLPGSAVTLAGGDVDGNGSLDVMLSRTTPWPPRTDLLLLRQQGGTFTQTFLGASQGANGFLPRVDISLVDLDADGDLDAALLVSLELGSWTTRFTTYRNDGSGGFLVQGSVSLPGLGEPMLSVADVDGDGDRDVVVAGRTTNGQALPAVLLQHDGQFGFHQATNGLPATPVTAPQFADLDGDQDPDLLVVDGSGNVLAWTNQGGTFAGGPVAAVAARYVVAGDLDGDGDQDGLAQRADGSLWALANTGAGFTTQALTGAGVATSQRPVLADLDGDLDLDVAVVVDGELRVLHNGGASSFTSTGLTGTGTVATGDANQDGIADLLFTGNGQGVGVALGQPGNLVFDPVWLRAAYSPVAGRGFTEQVADLDGDDRVDVVQQDNYQVIVRRNRGVGEWSTVSIALPFLRPKVRAADLDGDGDQDLVVTNNETSGGMLVLRHDPGFTFTTVLQPNPGYVNVAGIGDFDGDQRADLLLGTGAGLQLRRSLGAGVFAPPVTVHPAYAPNSRVGVWDFDADADLDLLVKQNSTQCMALLTNDGNGSFTVTDACAANVPSYLTYSSDVELVDLDGDGDPELFAGTYGSGQVFVNVGGSYQAGQVIQGVFGSALMQPLFADWDADGDQDLLQLGGPPQLWLNAGNGLLVDSGQARVGWTEFSAAGAGDLDGDGDIDPVGVLGLSLQHRSNHQRSASSLTAPTPGGQMQVRYAHDPGIATGNTLCIPILTLARRPTPLRVPGIAGSLQIDMTTAVLLPALVFPAPNGTATSAFAIPLQPGLLGFDLHGQGVMLNTAAMFSPAIHERIL